MSDCILRHEADERSPLLFLLAEEGEDPHELAGWADEHFWLLEDGAPPARGGEEVHMPFDRVGRDSAPPPLGGEKQLRTRLFVVV